MSNLITIPRNGGLVRKANNRFTNFPTMFNLFDDLFYGDYPTVFSTDYSNRFNSPKINIKESKDTYTIEVAAPGLDKSDFEINLDNKTLSISAKNESKESDNDNGYARREFSYTSFNRNFTLPDSVDDAKIKAEYKDGILNVSLPKKEEAKQKPSRAIDVS
jgi:HSP20 family protein